MLQRKPDQNGGYNLKPLKCLGVSQGRILNSAFFTIPPKDK
jgi:hypothetical protein